MPAKVYLETFGCQMNELDSELVAGALRARGYLFTADRSEADVVLYNTCSVRQQAEQKVWSRLGQDKFAKAARPELVVGVLGCMAERDGVDLIRRMPVVDILVGPGELDKLPALVDNAVRTNAAMAMDAEVATVRPQSAAANRARATDGSAADEPTPPDHRAIRSAGLVALQGNTSRRSGTLAAAADDLEMLDLSRAISPTDGLRGGRGGSAYVRITRGCNKFCTYCVVPFTRGAEMHRPPRHIIDECKRLADAGVIEVTLLGQTVNHYRFEHDAAVEVDGVVQPQKGRTYKGGHNRDAFAGERVTTFADLLHRIHEEVPAIRRLRFVTSYPRDFGDDVLQVMRDCERICRYLHVPAQSGSNRILKRMNRGYTVEEYFQFLDRARSILDQPEIGRPLTVAGDIIVGFPTETEEDFEATKGLLRRARYKNCFIFKYSPRPGTVAFDKIADDVPDEVKRRRNNELLALQQQISSETSSAYIGRTVNVFVEGLSEKQKKRARAGEGEGRGGQGAINLTIGGRDPAREAAAAAIAANPAGAAIQLSGRTDGDLIVFFDLPERAAPDDLIGTIVPVAIRDAQPLALFGEIAS